jgi:undecaprenyl-diphosphatase
MDYLYPLILGLIQGLTEFLPISSTGHLVLIAKFFHIPSNLAFDAFIHLGSFLAILIYFWKDLREIWSLKWYIIVSAIPGALAGFTLEHFIENHLRSPLMVAFFLSFMSLPLLLGERFGKKENTLRALSFSKALGIGLFQALALLPGTSRSGITISAGLILGLKREDSARYSFLAGAPLILGAGLYEGLKLIKTNSIPLTYALTGFFSSALFSFLAIAFLLNFLKKHSLYPFILYRILLALLVVLIYIL